MIRQASTDGTMLAMLIKNREMTGRIQTRPWWLEGEGVKTTEKKFFGPDVYANLEAELLDGIGTKVQSVFLHAIHGHQLTDFTHPSP
jgi:hypothetical protein